MPTAALLGLTLVAAAPPGEAPAEPAVAITTVNGQTPTGPGYVKKVVKHELDISGTATVPATAAAALVADAGDSAFVEVGAAHVLHGIVPNADGDVPFAWSIDGDASRFDDASLPSPSLDTDGLEAGDLVVTLDATDASGATATDTVTLSLYVREVRTLVAATQDISLGLPEETVDRSLGGLIDGESYTHDFTVPSGASDLAITLGWTDDLNDLDLYATTPEGDLDDTSAASSANPEILTVSAPEAGAWAAEVHTYLSGPDTYDLTATAVVTPADPLPTAATDGPFSFVIGDAQTLTGTAAGGTAPYTITWDLDRDGVADATETDADTSTVTSSFGVGTHLVTFKVTDANGYEWREVTAVRVSLPGQEPKTPGIVVVAVTDTGLNLYHRDWRATTYPDADVLALTENFTKHPSTYLNGYPADAASLPITLGDAYFPAEDAGIIAAIEPETLYWVPGTKIIGARDDGSSSGATSGEDLNPILDEDGHGTASASVAVGNIYGWCPSCLLAAGEGFGNDGYFNVAPWVDITSNSFGNIANIGFTPLIDEPAQPKESAEAGQIAMYAAGNGAANAFVVPINTYVPPTTGPDWLVRVGAAERSSRKPVLGTGKPVDITSWGSGDIPSAGIGAVNNTHNHSGTSAATPLSAGVIGDVLRRVRIELGDDTNGWANGDLADGTAVAGSPYLADGVLSRAELLAAVYRTAEHDDGADFSIYPFAPPSNPYQYLLEGYGIVEPRTGQNAFEVLLGARPMPERPAEDAFYADYDEPIRNEIWGTWDSGENDGAGGAASSPTTLDAAALELALASNDFATIRGFMEQTFGPLPQITSSVEDGGVSDQPYALITTPSDGATVNVDDQPTIVVAGDYGLPAGVSTNASTSFFLRADACTDDPDTGVVANNRLSLVDGIDGEGDDCGYNPLAAAIDPVLPIQRSYPLEGEDITLGSGTIDGTVFVNIDTPSPVTTMSFIVTTRGGGGTEEIARASATVTGEVLAEGVPFDFSMEIPEEWEHTDLDGLTFTIDYGQAEGQVTFSLDDPASFVNMPVASTVGGGGSVEISVDDPSFADPILANTANGLFTATLDGTTLTDGAHTVSVRATAGGATSTPQTTTFVVTRSGDVTVGTVGRVELQIVPEHATTSGDGWIPVLDTSADGDFSTWRYVADVPLKGRWTIHTRVVVDGDAVAAGKLITFRTKRKR